VRRGNVRVKMHGSRSPLFVYDVYDLMTMMTVITRSSTTAKSTARPSCLVGVLYVISREKISVAG